MSEIKATLLVMYYVIDENKNQVELERALNTIVSTESVSAVGLALTIDGIECYGINGTVNRNTYITGRSEYSGNGNAIFVDKNHDLSYYFTGSSYVNVRESTSVINTANKYAYQWGGYRITTGATATAIGAGLSNTNSLIGMNLQPYTDGWYVVWDKIKEFRQSHSDKWFLPSKDELNLVYEARNNLNNLSLNTSYSYLSSSEISSTSVWFQRFVDDYYQGSTGKDYCSIRSRLCVQY